MATRYWVGGTGSWDTTNTTNWSTTSGGSGGASIPTSLDDVVFDENSHSTSYTVTIASNVECKNFTVDAPSSGSLTWARNTGFFFDIYGSLLFNASGRGNINGIIAYTSSGPMRFYTSGNETITTNGINILGDVYKYDSGTLSLGSALDISGITSSEFSVFAGTFNTQNYNLTCWEFKGSNSTIILGSSTVECKGTSAISFGTSVSLDAGTSTVIASSSNPSFSGGDNTFYDVSFTSSGANFSISKKIFGNNTFNSLSFTTRTLTGMNSVRLYGNQTVGTLSCKGAAANKRIFVHSDTLGTQRTLSVNTWTDPSYIDFRDILLTGNAATLSGTRLGDCGNNTGITFEAPKTVYWDLAGTQNWSATGWKSAVTSSPSDDFFPLPQDTAVIDNSGGLTTLNVNQEYYNISGIDTTRKTDAITLNFGSNDVLTYGDLKFGSSTTLQNNTDTLFLLGDKDVEIQTSGKTLMEMDIHKGPNSTVKLLDDLVLEVSGSSKELTLVQGNLNMNNKTITSLRFISNSSNTRSLNMGSGTWNILGNSTAWNTSSSFNVSFNNDAEISMSSSSTKVFLGSTLSWPTLVQSGAGKLDLSNSLNIYTLKNTVNALIDLPYNGNITVTNFNVRGAAGDLLTINGDGGTITHNGDSNIVTDYLDITNCEVISSYSWYAGANSIDNGGNSGWIFAEGPSAFKVNGVEAIDSNKNLFLSGLKLENTEGFQAAAGKTVSRPSTPSQGDFRFNTETGFFEGYDGTQWVTFDNNPIERLSSGYVAVLGSDEASYSTDSGYNWDSAYTYSGSSFYGMAACGDAFLSMHYGMQTDENRVYNKDFTKHTRGTQSLSFMRPFKSPDTGTIVGRRFGSTIYRSVDNGVTFTTVLDVNPSSSFNSGLHYADGIWFHSYVNTTPTIRTQHHLVSTDDGISWTELGPESGLPMTSNGGFQGFSCFMNGLHYLYAPREFGAAGLGVYVSPDGYEWTFRGNVSNANIGDNYGNTKNVFYNQNDGYFYNCYGSSIRRSLDGVTFTNYSTVTSYSGNGSGTYNDGVFIACGYSSGNRTIYTSTDPENNVWTLRYTSPNVIRSDPSHALSINQMNPR